MGRRQRMYADEGMYFVTARTFQGRMLLSPSAQLNEAVGGVLARGVALSGVELHAFVVVSNHLHLLVTAKGAKLSEFMKYVLCNTSKKVGRLVDWSGSLWERRFAVAPVLDDASAEDRIRYIVSHGVKEGLVRRPEQWPGLSCLTLLRDGGSAAYRFFHWARRWKKGVLRQGGSDLWSQEWADTVTLTLVPIPSWRNLTRRAISQRVAELVQDIVNAGKVAHKSVLGAKAVQKQDPHRRPQKIKKSIQPNCHAATAEIQKALEEKLRLWTSDFISASKRFLEGDLLVIFPRWARRPSALVSAAAEAEQLGALVQCG